MNGRPHPVSPVHTHVHQRAEHDAANDSEDDDQTYDGLEKGKDRFLRGDRGMTTPLGQQVLCDVINDLMHVELQSSVRRRKRKAGDQQTFNASVEAIVCDLAHAELTQDYRGTAVPRSKQVLCTQSPYSPWWFGNTLPGVLDLMEHSGYINQEIGFKAHNQRTLITAGDVLIDAIASSGLTLADIGQTHEAQTIILKDHSKKLMTYKDNELVCSMRSEMEIINEALAAAAISFDYHSQPQVGPIDVNHRRLYRVFTDGSFTSHGRLYGGFWIRLHKEERLRGITIDGQPIVGLDYGQTFPRIAYGLVGATPPDTDLYAIPGLEGFREGIKKLTNAMLNCPRILQKKPKGTKPLLPPDMNIHQLQTIIRSHHEPIANLFASDIGQTLFYRESQLLVALLLRLNSLGIVALPVHDCIITREDHEIVATHIMKEMFQEMVGVTASVKRECVATSVMYDE